MHNQKEYHFNEKTKEIETSSKTFKSLDQMKYGKTRGSIYLKKYLPNIAPFTEINLV